MAVPDLIGTQIQRVGGVHAPHMLGALRSLRGGIVFGGVSMGRNTSAYTSATAGQRRKHVAGRPEPVEQGFPLNGHLGLRLGLAAGGQGAGTVGAAKPAIHKQGHLGPHRDRRNEQYQNKLNQSDAHKLFSFAKGIDLSD